MITLKLLTVTCVQETFIIIIINFQNSCAAYIFVNNRILFQEPCIGRKLKRLSVSAMF